MSAPRLKLAASSPRPSAPSRQIRGFAPAHLSPIGGLGRDRAARQRVTIPDAILWRRNFARIWQAFLLARWGDDAQAVAAAFEVRTQTARNWLAGLHVPTGDVAARAMLVWRPEILAAALRVGVR